MTVTAEQTPTQRISAICDRVAEVMLSRGWIRTQIPYREGVVDSWYKLWYPTDGVPPCICNERTQVLVTLYDISPWLTYEARSTYVPTVSAEITGEYRPNSWIKLDIYSTPAEEFMANMDMYIQDVIHAWTAIANRT